MTIIKAGLCGDLHLNVARREAEAQRVAYWLVNDAKARGAHFLGIGGDGLDGPMTEKFRAWLLEFNDYAASLFPVFWLMGNHEAELALRCLRGRQTKYPVIVEEGAGVHVVETEAGPLVVVGVSYPYKAKLLAMTGPTSGEDTNLIAEGELRKVFLGLGVKVRELNLPTVALIHGAWRGSKIAENQPDRPLGIEIPIEDMGQLGAGGYCVPHVHLAQETSWQDSPIWTPSAPIFTDYGEAGHFKGYIFAEADSETKKVTFTRIPTPVTPMVLMEYKWEDGMFLRATAQKPGQDPDPLNGEQLQESHYDAQGVDFRFRYHYAKEFAAAAKNAADEVKAMLSAAGAVNVSLDPKLIPTTRAKIPGLSTATKIEDKLRLYWESTGNIPIPALALQINSCLHELQDELAMAGYTITGAGRTAPRIKKVEWKDFFKFPGKHEIDFSKLGELVTIIAPNETGKTILLQMISAGVNYGTTPTRGSLDDLSIDTKSFIEVTQDMNGDEYILTQNCNGMSRSGTVGLIKNGNRNDPVLSRAGRAEYKAWASTNLIPQNLYDSVICQSGTESVIDQKDGPRTELLLRVLGLEILELLAEAARKRAKAVSDELERVRAVIAELQSGQTIEFCEESLARVTDEKRVADETLRLGELTLKDLQGKNVVIEKQRAEYDALVLRKAELESQETKLRERIADLDERIKNNGDILGKAVEIRTAVARSEDIGVALVKLNDQVSAHRILESDLNAEARQIESEERSADEKAKALQQELQRLNALIAGADAARSAAASIPDFEESLKETEHERDRALAEYDELQDKAAASGDASRKFLRGELGYIANGKAEDPVAYAGSALSADELAVKEIAERPKQILNAKAVWQQADARAKEIAGQLMSLRLEAAKLTEIDRSITLRGETTRSMVLLGDAIVSITTRKNENATKRGEQLGNLGAANSTITALTAEAGDLKLLASRAAPLAEAETKIAAYQEERGRLDTEHSAILASMVAISGEMIEPPPAVPLAPYETAVAEARAEANRCQSAFTLAQKALTDAQAKETRRQELTARVGSLEIAQAIWTRLGLNLGKDELQKAEICEAGPELTRITNELLALVGDTRHSVSIETERLHSNKKDTIPCLDIMVFDSVEGVSKESRLLSDAGKIIVGWPFSLALIRLGCERAGIKGPTIFIDEATGPCDSENAPRCAQMLRHFAQQNESQVVYVSQQPEIQALADSRITIGDQGAISIT